MEIKTKAEQDLINRKEIVDKICYLVNELRIDSNFCLALNGGWGSGKSFVIEYLAEELQKQEEYIVIKYDAWKNNFYTDPLIAILYCVLDSVKEYFHYTEDVVKKFKKLKGSFYKTLLDFVKKASDKDEKIKIGYYVVKKVFEIISSIKSSIVDDKKFEEFKSYQTLLAQAQTVLNEITAYPLIGNKQTKLVILVDEIDRCLPDEQLKILERLHHLFEVKNCAVIVAINRKSVTQSFKHLFDNSGELYLHKFFKYNFALQPCSEIFLENSFQKMKDEWNNILPADLQLLAEDIDYIQRYVVMLFRNNTVIDLNDRECERYLEIFSSINNKIEEKNINFYHLWFVAVVVFYKLYQNGDYREYLNGRKDYKLKDMAAISYLRNSDLQRRGEANYYIRNKYGKEEIQYINIYYDNKINDINYMVNLFLYRKSSNNAVVEIFENRGMNILWDQEELERILKNIENLS